jgi:hypothetical protein
MRAKTPTHILIDQVRITREGGDATVDGALSWVLASRG